MQYTGPLYKMKTKLNNPVDYWLLVGENEIYINDLLGKNLKLEFLGNIFCLNCSRKTKTSFGQGHCFVCFRKLARCDSCIMQPEKCHYHLGTCREPEWGLSHCFIPHIIYLSNTSGLKIGVTRHTQVPTRWIDQGATEALAILEVNSRYHSGVVEHHLKNYLNDKTNWRAMLKGDAKSIDLKLEAKNIIAKLLADLAKIENIKETDLKMLDGEIVKINYPVLKYPEKVASFNFDKNPIVSGKLMGIKGQYLIFDTGVINIRKFTSYEINFSY